MDGAAECAERLEYKNAVLLLLLALVTFIIAIIIIINIISIINIIISIRILILILVFQPLRAFRRTIHRKEMRGEVL